MSTKSNCIRMHQNPSFSFPSTNPLRHLQHHSSTNLQRDLRHRENPPPKSPLQLSRLRPRPRQSHVGLSQPRRAHGVPRGGRVVDQPNKAAILRSGVLPRSLRHQGEAIRGAARVNGRQGGMQGRGRPEGVKMWTGV
ncbi:hypothetical protein Ancab_037314 [Ancistrocladus abbreviatus]